GAPKARRRPGRNGAGSGARSGTETWTQGQRSAGGRAGRRSGRPDYTSPAGARPSGGQKTTLGSPPRIPEPPERDPPADQGTSGAKARPARLPLAPWAWPGERLAGTAPVRLTHRPAPAASAPQSSGGSSTASTTWMTPFDASTSASVMVASSVSSLPSVMVTSPLAFTVNVASSSARVSTSSPSDGSATSTVPSTTWYRSTLDSSSSDSPSSTPGLSASN